MCVLKNHFDSKWLGCYNEEMKYDLTHVHCAKAKKSVDHKQEKRGEEMQTLEV